MRIIAYAYSSDVHCPTCTIARFGLTTAQLQSVPGTVETDSNGISIHQEDDEGNPLGTIFSTDEQLEPLFCGDCRNQITL